ncbi:MAG: hypothetical protein MZU97_06490 [Bacillus subtilis]|nr:hypothetical protein [Bacillus subtilis]
MLLIGVVVTGIIQSSSAVTTILISMVGAGLMIGSGGNAVLYVILGTNIGTTVTALLSSIGASPNAKRAARDPSHVQRLRFRDRLPDPAALAVLPRTTCWRNGSSSPAPRSRCSIPSSTSHARSSFCRSRPCSRRCRAFSSANAKRLRRSPSSTNAF